jgi:hypothetical protein
MGVDVMRRAPVSVHRCPRWRGIAGHFGVLVLMSVVSPTHMARAQATTTAPSTEPAPASDAASPSASTPTASFEASAEQTASAPPANESSPAEPEGSPPAAAGEPAAEQATPVEAVPAAEPPPASPATQTAPAPDETLDGQRYFGVGPSGLVYAGFGGTVTLGIRDVFLAAGIGWQPILIMVQNMTDATMDLKFFSTSQIDADLVAIVAHPEPRLGIGFTGGYRKNSLLGDGVALGAALTYELTRHLRILGMAGLMVFPKGEDNIKDHLDVCDGMTLCDVEFGFPGPSLQDGLGGALVFHP